MTQARSLADTSLFVALEVGRPLDADLLRQWEPHVISVVTVAELQAGVLAAAGVDSRAHRLSTLEELGDIQVLGVDEHVAKEWARLRVFLAERRRRLNINDLWIAATAAAHGLPIVTQDRDFDALSGAVGVTVIQV